MKKTLLASICCLWAALGSAQTLLADDASAYSIGNVGTDMTGATPGQGGWLTTVTDGSNSDFQIVDAGGDYGNVIQITGSSTAVNNRRMFKDMSVAWAGRDSGNEVAQVQFSFFTGPATTSANSMRVVLYDQSLTKMLAGLTYITATRELRGLGYYDNAGSVGNYSFTLGFNGLSYQAVTLASNTWYTLGFSFNRTTGELVFKELSGTMITAPSIMGNSVGEEISTLNLVANAISTGGQANSVSATGRFDNLNFRALAADSPLLRTTDLVAQNAFEMYPNPTSNVVNIETVGQIKSVSVADMNGRIVKQQAEIVSDQTQLDLSDLGTGVYIMTVQGESGSATKKIVKQ